MQYHSALMQPTLTFIGGGNMAGALIGGLIAAGHSSAHLRAAEPDPARAEILRRQFGITVDSSAAALVKGAKALVLAVKPQQVAAALQGLQPDAGATVLSIAAGVRLETLRAALGANLHYVRSMPNTPALYGAGISGLYAPPGTPPNARQLAEEILRSAGETVWLEREEDMDAVTALSGSGPAYFFLLTEVLREAGAALGLAPDTAAKLAQQTFIGAAAMAANSGADVSQLRANVTSKGGTTEAAVRHLETAGIRSIFADALRAAQQRGVELGDLLAKGH